MASNICRRAVGKEVFWCMGTVGYISLHKGKKVTPTSGFFICPIGLFLLIASRYVVAAEFTNAMTPIPADGFPLAGFLHSTTQNLNKTSNILNNKLNYLLEIIVNCLILRYNYLKNLSS